MKATKKNYSERNVRGMIEQYMGGVKFSLSVTMAAHTADVELEYEDFRPERQVRRDIEDMLPLVRFSTLNRTYSEGAYGKALVSLFQDSLPIYIESADGLQRTNLVDLSSERLTEMCL